jgi:hypothetical protein
MIVHPKIGQAVRLRYRKLRRVAPYHDRTGTVMARSKGPGPRNHLVNIGGDLVIVPCGHLKRVERKGEQG